MLNLVLRVWLPLVKKQPSKVVFLLCCKGGGGLILLRHACNCKQTRSRSPPPLIPPPTTLFFVGATCCRLVTSEAVSSEATVANAVKLKVKGGDIALLAQSIANLNLAFSRCGSRRLKFANLSKGSRSEVFLRLDAADLKFCDGSYLVGSDRAKFKSNKV